MSFQAAADKIHSSSRHAGEAALNHLSLGLLLLAAFVNTQAMASDSSSDELQDGSRPRVVAAADGTCRRHADCSDGNACNGLEICRDGLCSAGDKLNCAPRNACVFSMCDPRTGCKERPLSSGSCDDGNLCTTGDVCQDGVCVGGQAVTCRNEGPCVFGICDPSTGCSTKAARDGTVCDDGREDTKNDSCKGGRCRGEGVDPAILEQMKDDELFDFQQDPDYDPS
ncbi:MAG: hypothetical protein VX252_07075 [Myxococcota bacterium]|nr:hypothetical protein [Myxococcota bacterium]